MPSAAATFHGGGLAVATAMMPNPLTVSCRICLCNVKPKNPSRNAWAVFKEGNNGFRVAWLRTGSDGFGYLAAAAASDGTESSTEGLNDGGEENGREVEKGVPASLEKPVRVHNRRNRDSSVLAGNLDLLAIPGVGPRNLRKLVGKGIAGIAELKQLYRDKVYRVLVGHCCVLCFCLFEYFHCSWISPIDFLLSLAGF